jgi:ethanolamine ammonia-lyase small subunit
MNKVSSVDASLWNRLRRFTDARIGLGRTGISLTTQEQLKFQLDHANARDAIHIPFDTVAMTQELSAESLSSMSLHSQADNRAVYLQRPDLGRRLNSMSVEIIQQYKNQGRADIDVAVIIADGLSSTAVHRHSVSLAKKIIVNLHSQGMNVAPVCTVSQGRVAIGDEIGELFNAKMTILLIGERPGLSSPDSLGIYYTYQPKLGLTDASRNCLSNIRPAGMKSDEALSKLMWLVKESMLRGGSGVGLKDESDNEHDGEQLASQVFLLQKPVA